MTWHRVDLYVQLTGRFLGSSDLSEYRDYIAMVHEYLVLDQRQDTAIGCGTVLRFASNISWFSLLPWPSRLSSFSWTRLCGNTLIKQRAIIPWKAALALVDLALQSKSWFFQTSCSKMLHVLSVHSHLSRSKSMFLAFYFWQSLMKLRA